MTRTREDSYLPALDKAAQHLAQQEPYETAFKAGCDYDPVAAHIIVPYWGQPLYVTLAPVAIRRGDGPAPDVTSQLLTLHYLIQADGAPPGDRWIAFRELPDARVYDPAFQGRSSVRIVQEFGNDEHGLALASAQLGGERLTFGDMSFMFRAFPRARLALVFHRGDEEFPPAAQVLFDASVGHYLPTEDLAVLGGVLATELVRANRHAKSATGSP